ncbi:MAG: alpha/beta hydrolase [Solirubrobacterales bacterium]|nr:alpha/beta hydrolase [Solirubrobacterales bacterium]
MSSFRHGIYRLSYTEFGDGPRHIVLLPGLLFSQRMHIPLALTLAEAGHHVITLDVLGHGSSDRPREMSQYSMEFFAEQTVALLDHLEIDQAVIGGTSLGANATLEVEALAPERVRGMLIDMPVLENALLGCAIAFTPLMLALTFGEPGMKLVQILAKAIPRERLPQLGDVLLDWLRQDPGPSASVLQGLFFGRIAPHRDVRRTFTAPTLVIGHHSDPVHPFSDAGMLASELPNARLIQAGSIFELRTRPQRLTGEILSFLDQCWKPKRVAKAKPKAKPKAQVKRPAATLVP